MNRRKILETLALIGLAGGPYTANAFSPTARTGRILDALNRAGIRNDSGTGEDGTPLSLETIVAIVLIAVETE